MKQASFELIVNTEHGSTMPQSGSIRQGMTFGRSLSCDISTSLERIPPYQWAKVDDPNEIPEPLEDCTVSRRHGEFHYKDDGRLVYRDHSRHGTRTDLGLLRGNEKIFEPNRTYDLAFGREVVQCGIAIDPDQKIPVVSRFILSIRT